MLNQDNFNKYFEDVPKTKILYNAKANVDDTLTFKYYNASEILMGQKMEDWLRFSVCYWHTFRGTGTDPFGCSTIKRSWDDETNSMENAKRRLQIAFEFMHRLGITFWTFHDRDIAPEGKDLIETNKNLDEITDLAKELQDKYNIKLLWATCNLFSNPIYANGASTNPDAHVVAYAGAQVKKGLEIAKKLGSLNYVFWGGREGFQSTLNTDVSIELRNMANFFHMVVGYKKRISLNCQLLIEPKPKEPSKHQYDYDVMTVIAFLKKYNLDNDFKINVEPNHTTLAGHSYEHDLVMASAHSMLGSIDANTGSPDLGWDTDQFPMDIKNCTMMMLTVLKQGGIQPGGLNFDAKVRRESTNIRDMFIAHIGAMDTLARALRIAIKILEDGIFENYIKQRYLSFTHDIGGKIASGTATLENLEEFILSNGKPQLKSGQQEHYEAMLNRYL